MLSVAGTKLAKGALSHDNGARPTGAIEILEGMVSIAVMWKAVQGGASQRGRVSVGVVGIVLFDRGHRIARNQAPWSGSRGRSRGRRGRKRGAGRGRCVDKSQTAAATQQKKRNA